MKILNGEAILGDCLEEMKNIADGSIDLIVTSPPYDNLRTYNNTLNWNLDIFKHIAKECTRVIKKGGVIVWIVGDATIKGSESGTSFRQALYFKDECGLNLHDTMIFAKENYVPLTHNRYEQEFEYMFIFSKGKPKTFNPIKIPTKWGGTETWGKSSFYKTNKSGLISTKKNVIKDTKIKGNIHYYRTGLKGLHPAIFPEKLAEDNIKTWSNEGDLVLDCFAGSFTTAVAAENTNRKWICIEKVSEYYEIGINRLNNLFTNKEICN